MTENLTSVLTSSRPWKKPAWIFQLMWARVGSRHEEDFTPTANIACDVDEVLWPFPDQRLDAGAGTGTDEIIRGGCVALLWIYLVSVWDCVVACVFWVFFCVMSENKVWFFSKIELLTWIWEVWEIEFEVMDLCLEFRKKRGIISRNVFMQSRKNCNNSLALWIYSHF